MWDVERLKQLWAEGFSATEIGQDMGKTRNAVLGKVFRLRREGHEFKERQVYSPPNSGPKGRSRVRPQPTTKKRKYKKLPDEYQANAYDPQSGGVEFMDRGKRQCAYITSGDREYPTMCCGVAVVEGASWCPKHYEICFREPMVLSDAVVFIKRLTMLTKTNPASRISLAGNRRVASYDTD